MATDGGWTLVSRSRGGSRKHRYGPPAADQCSPSTTAAAGTESEDLALVAQTKLLVERAIQNVRSSAFFTRFLSEIRTRLRPSLSRHRFSEIVIYGLGSISASEVSRCQLALALLLRHELPSVRTILVYDPVISASEQAVLRDLGCCPMDINEQGLRKVAMPTLFYMPHCEADLYDNVLQANWDCLSHVGILGNSFQSYRQRWAVHPSPSLAYPVHVLKIQPLVQEYHVNAMDFPAISAFNDMSWHFFTEHGQQSVTEFFPASAFTGVAGEWVRHHSCQKLKRLS